jgi:hypothetical protein
MKIVANIIIYCILILALPANARYANLDEAGTKVISLNVDLTIEKSGQYKAIYEKTIELLNESGREQNSSTTLVYSKDISDINIIEAYTDNKGIISKVDPSSIEVKPLASSAKGFDQKYQILINYPNSVVGSKLYLKYEERLHTPIIDNHYSNAFFYGLNEYIEDSNIKITCKIPNAKFKTHDPNQALTIEEKKTKEATIYNIKQIKPQYFALINEPYSISVNYDDISYINLSSISSYKDISEYFYPKYNSVISQSLPDKLKKIVDSAKEIKDEHDQIDFITSSIANNISYMGSWQTVKGKFFPRDLKEIVDTGYADCKEYSSSLSAILNNLGYKANVALVQRSFAYYKPKDIFPSMQEFNHAIVNVNTPSGKNLWIDPTNFISMSRGTHADISGRESLVLSDSTTKTEFIPFVDYNNSRIKQDIELTYDENTVDNKGSIEFKGESSRFLTGAELETSKKAIEEYILKNISGEVNPEVKLIDIPSLKSRIVSDLKISYHLSNTAEIINTNNGKAYYVSSLKQDWLNFFIMAASNEKGIAFLDVPMSNKKSIVVKNFKIKSPEKLNYTINNKWFEASRQAAIKDNDLVIEEEVKIKESYVMPNEISEEFIKKLKKNIKQNMSKTIIIRDF